MNPRGLTCPGAPMILIGGCWLTLRVGVKVRQCGGLGSGWLHAQLPNRVRLRYHLAFGDFAPRVRLCH